MATMILLPNANGVISTDWIPVGETEVWECLDDDNSATSYVKCNDGLEYMIIEFAIPSVAEAEIDTIDAVRFLSSGKAVHRSDPSTVRHTFEVPSGNPNEDVSYDAHRTNFETINGTSRTTNGLAAWSYANLEALEMKVSKLNTIEVHLSYLALEVTYTSAVSADNATFFGANF